jgi:16S rRNA (cytidine1402-2'-O)-methyltransferase
LVYFISTPIGNLDDISSRVINILPTIEIVYCEDTRVTKKLLHLLSLKYNISLQIKSFISLHSHNELSILKSIDIDMLHNKNIAYMSDAGMPCISDPGANFVQFCIENNISYDLLSGPNALTLAYAMSGFTETEFTFFGFLPHKGENRREKLNYILTHPLVSILYESPYRLLKLFQEISKISPSTEIFLIKELTKLHQKFYKGKAIDILNNLQKDNIKGEWVVIIKPNSNFTYSNHITVSDIIDLDLPPKQKAKLISRITNKSIKDVYQELMKT